jgi:hypothetical protein
VGIFIVDPGKELADRAGLPFGGRPIDLAWRFAMITTTSASMTLASTANPSPSTRPASMHALTTASKSCRKISPSRNRPWRLTENVE